MRSHSARLLKFCGTAALFACWLFAPREAWSARQPSATVTPVWVGGTLTSGGSVFYRANVNATNSAPLILDARLTGRRLNVRFPVTTNITAFGQQVITGPSVNIPTNFVGPVRLTMRAKHGSRWLRTTITRFDIGLPQSRVPAATIYEAGFDSLVTMNANVASTNGLGASRTYAWTQTAGPAVTLDDAASATPSFTTLSLTNFVELGHEMGLVGMDSLQVTESTYKFQVLVSDGTLTRTGTVSVISGSTNPAQLTLPLGVRQYFKADTDEHPSFAWTLVSFPSGSVATLGGADTRTPSLVPDKTGAYVIRDDISGDLITVRGATFVGVATCALCHGPNPVVADLGLQDMVTPWSQTGHATFLERALDGQVSAHYNESCLPCHSVGYNKAPGAVHDGFDDLAVSNNWVFPTPLQAGNFAAMPDDVKTMANIQCESCHGPGSAHVGAPSESLNAAVCATCHQDGHYHTRVEQWEQSAHAEPYYELSEEEGTNPSCARCHSPAGFLDTQKGKATVRAQVGQLTCQTCHDPHNVNGYPHQVRVFDTVNAYSGMTFSGAGTSATCMYCHNARRTIALTGSFSSPHGNPASEMLSGQGGQTYGETIANSEHTALLKCADCHMAANPGMSSPDHNKLGDHTFSTSYLDGTNKVEYVAVCNACHGDATSFDYLDPVTGGDFDGDGVVAGVQTEVQNLLDLLKAKLISTGISNVPPARGTSPWNTNSVIGVSQRKAVWNWALVNNDKSKGVHNTSYAVGLLQRSYSNLSTNTGGNTFIVDYPSATLR